ncbi:Protein of unknown function [Alteromonadaceae bacterium Bs31]|nr:Protein of unknown function [Alteromonadaceae bacterium Bs31]
MNKKIRIALTNSILFQLVWFVAVQGNNAAALAVTAVFFLVHAVYIFRSVPEITFIALFGAAGWLLDSLGNTFGLIHFAGAQSISVLGIELFVAPLWLLCVWLTFASVLLYSLYWLNGRVITSAILGFIIVPANYWLGAKMSGSEFLGPVWSTLLIEGLVWALILPFGVKLAKAHCEADHQALMVKEYV